MKQIDENLEEKIEKFTMKLKIRLEQSENRMVNFFENISKTLKRFNERIDDFYKNFNL